MQEIMQKQRLLLILCLINGFGNFIFGQTGSREKFISLNIHYYQQTKKPFSFKKEDLSNFEFSQGIFLCPGYTEYINKRLFLIGEIGFGVFRKINYLSRDTLREYRNRMIPFNFWGKYQAVRHSKFSLTIVLGGGSHIIFRNEKNSLSQASIHETFIKLSYTYGLEMGIKIKKELWLGLGYSITTVGNLKFRSGSLILPIYGL